MSKISNCVLLALYVLGSIGCTKRISAHNINAPGCPPVRVVAAGSFESYEIAVDIEGREPVLLVPQIDMPNDVSQYVKYARPSVVGVDIGIVQSDYAKDLNIRVSGTCVVKTVRVAP